MQQRYEHLLELCRAFGVLTIPSDTSAAQVGTGIVFLRRNPLTDLGYCEALHEIAHVALGIVPDPRVTDLTTIRVESAAWWLARYWAQSRNAWSPDMQDHLVSCLSTYTRAYGQTYELEQV